MKLIRWLSGLPKDKDLGIKESINPFFFFPEIIIAFVLIYLGFKVNPVFAFISPFSAWQAGWGMSIERFLKYDKREAEKLIDFSKNIIGQTPENTEEYKNRMHKWKLEHCFDSSRQQCIICCSGGRMRTMCCDEISKKLNPDYF